MHVLLKQFLSVRQISLTICDPLEIEDYVIQTCFDVSPIKWHLAHTSWFFEEFILKRFYPDYIVFHNQYGYLFNSYYNSIGDRVMKDIRGILSRPTVAEINDYRNYINQYIVKLIDNLETATNEELFSLLEIGINHEQQHQELMIYDIKHIFFVNPTKPIYDKKELTTWPRIKAEMISFDGGLFEFGHKNNFFAFDNEFPKHKSFLNPFAFQNRLVTNGDYMKFILDNGYNRPELWLADGWDYKHNQNWKQPMYWQKNGETFQEWVLSGFQDIDLNKPVNHISFYEAYAFAKWSNKRLPTEYEFEQVANSNKIETHSGFAENLYQVPTKTIKTEKPIKQLNGFAWQWTSSSYSPYPGYKQSSGAIGEYNGKFMSGQMVLRGGSYATDKTHYRITYRNFFQPEKRWLLNGIRLAEDIS